MKKWIGILVLCFVIVNCNSTSKKGRIKSESKNVEKAIEYVLDTLNVDTTKGEKSNKQDQIFATIDSVSLGEIKENSKANLSIFEYYTIETVDEVEIWSDKMFGRCCTEADLSYSELLDFEITANVENSKYPFKNLSDFKYQSAYVFKENEAIEISLKINRNDPSGWHTSQTNLEVDQVLKPNDTLLSPFRLSLVNGYTKSEATFKENGSVKTLDVYLNNTYKSTIMLQKTPLVQEFTVAFAFFKNDVIKLVPVSYYKGTIYDDICISEIQSSLAHITHPSLNKKYKIQKLRKN